MTIVNNISIVIPAKNEAESIGALLQGLIAYYPKAEIIVVNDGSTDATARIAKQLNVKVITHRYSKGNGAAIKAGAREAKNEYIVFMDGDGQHQPEHVDALMQKMQDGYDMVVGARPKASQANVMRYWANSIYNVLASKMVGHSIEDLTSGLRIVKADCFKRFLSLLPNGFSYPTTSTMAFFRAGYSVAYVSVNVERRVGKSHIKLLSDGVKFLLIIFKIATLYSPLKLFFPVSLAFFFTGVSYYGYTYIMHERFTNMSALLFSTSVIVFLMGLISEQITTLIYMQDNNDRL